MRSPARRRVYCVNLLIFSLVAAACSGSPNGLGGVGGFAGDATTVSVTQSLIPTLTPFLPLPPTNLAQTPDLTQVGVSQAATTPQVETILPQGASTPTGPSLWIASYLPAGWRQGFSVPEGLVEAGQKEGAALRFEVGDQNPVSTWVYALVAPFPTIQEGVKLEQLRSSWGGKKTGPFGGQPILMDESTYRVFEAWWGEPAPEAVKVLAAEKMLDFAWKNRPSWALIPFEELQPRWKVLEVSGQSPVRKEFDPARYPLIVPFSLSADPGYEGAASQLSQVVPRTNRDATKMTTVVLTGVTAMVRATAYVMERDGITSPAVDIRDWLRSADVTHISNEIPFWPSCPFPDPQQAGLRFCSSPRYIALLEDIGTDIIELTGDHFADWGEEATLYTLDMYRERGWPYYGGGANLGEGRRPVIVKNNGNQIAFIGCNAKGGGYATATDSRPGAVACDYEWMKSEIRRLKRKGFLVIATFQHQEIYSYSVSPGVREDFVRLVEAGADIVSGSQAHQPQGMEFVGESFMHFGLGNLFFDQYRFFPGPQTDQAFIDRHVIYDGRYISTELLPIQFVNLARSRPMTPDERAEFLDRLFTASRW